MRALLMIVGTVLVAPTVAADVQLCRPLAAEYVSVACETTPYPNGETHRSTQVEVELWHDAPLVPSFVLRVRFEEQDAGNSSAPRCSIAYYRHGGGPGPQSVEWGTAACIYPFYLETP